MSAFSALVAKLVGGVTLMGGIVAGSTLLVGDGIDASSSGPLTVGGANATSVVLAKPVTFGSTVTLPAGSVPLGGSVVTGTLPAANQAAQPASGLTGSSLASGVTSSSLTSVGTLANLTVTNPISGSVTGNAATCTLASGMAASNLTGTALPSSIVGSSLTSVGTLANLTVTNPISGSVTGNAATVTTNANLTGDVTSSGNATTLSASTVTGKALTGFVSGAGSVSSADTILSCVDKLDGNIALKAPIAGPTFTGNVNGPQFSFAGSLANDFESFGAAPSATGTIRLPNTYNIKTRNAANSADLNVALTDAGNSTVFGNTTGTTLIDGLSSGIVIRPNGSAIYTLSATSIAVNAGTGSMSLAYNSASTAAATGFKMSVKGQDETGTGATVGGDVEVNAGTGANSGNVNLVGPVVEGYFAQAMSDAPQTVSNANSRNNLFVTTGANTAVRALTLTRLPKAGTMVFVRDNCTGNGITVQFSTGSATGTIAPGASALVTSDGTNAIVLMTGT